MKNKFCMILLAFAVLTGANGCAHSDGPYKGKVIELDTGNPIEGAVVAASWTIEPFVHSGRPCDAREAVTDKKGEFELPEGRCISNPFAKLHKPNVVVFKPGYLGYPPLGASPEERKARMPGLTGREFIDEKQYCVIKLGTPKTRTERELTLGDAHSPIADDFVERHRYLIKLINEEGKNMGLTGEVYKNKRAK